MTPLTSNSAAALNGARLSQPQRSATGTNPEELETHSSEQRAAAEDSRGPCYWRSLDEYARTAEFREFLQREFPDHASEWIEGLSRRRFLKLMGASIALAGFAGCTRQPKEKIVPYVTQPEELIPGKPLYFATAMTLSGYATGLLVESHQGHPTKIEGNPAHPISLGAANVFHQASLLDLYDPDRSQAVLRNGEVSRWPAFLEALQDALQRQHARRGAGLRLLTETVTSPALHAQLRAVLEKFPEARWHQYEPVNRDHEHEGARLAFGEVVAPQYRFENARLVLALDSDFMFAHPAGLKHAREFTNARRVSAGRNEMNRFYAVESTPTVTGSNADHRLALTSVEITRFALALARRLHALPPDDEQPVAPPASEKFLNTVATDLERNRGASILIAGEGQPPAVHALAHAVNHTLGNFGKTIQLAASAEAAPVSQLESLRALVEGLNRGEVEVLVILGGNPAFNAPADLEFARALKRAPFQVHLSSEANETAALCQWSIPQSHYLESWSDARAYDGTVSIVQPLILPLYAGKSAHEVLDAFVNQPPRSDYDIVRDHWRGKKHWPEFEKGWRRALHDGVVTGTESPVRSVDPKADWFQQLAKDPVFRASSAALEVCFRLDPTIWDGRFANNGWLQELAKPITKMTWDNAAYLSPALARRLSLASGDLVELEAAGKRLRVPVWIVPGQAENSVTLHLGYGRKRVGRVGQGAGFNSESLRTVAGFWSAGDARLTKVRGRYQLATTQTHHTIDSAERQVYREGTFREFENTPEFIKASVETPHEHETLYHPHEHEYDGSRWAMSIDLTTCIGCNACVLACQAENNIPVVGKSQIAMRRDMQWIRVDTYFSGSPDNPAMNHQPVPCMHCENAPCELVCPVAATLHDKEGLNLQIYNRCIGTRYCSNNCPYKVRRFNFFQYADHHTPSLKPMRNPDVTVRWRGVMEKCTYCVQRISAARIAAKIENHPIREGEVLTACQQTCPAEAIVFGDLSDPNSRISKLKEHPLDYSMLGELNTRPRTTYLAKLRNPNPELAS